jgi:hypothetical protein
MVEVRAKLGAKKGLHTNSGQIRVKLRPSRVEARVEAELGMFEAPLYTSLKKQLEIKKNFRILTKA